MAPRQPAADFFLGPRNAAEAGFGSFCPRPWFRRREERKRKKPFGRRGRTLKDRGGTSALNPDRTGAGSTKVWVRRSDGESTHVPHACKAAPASPHQRVLRVLRGEFLPQGPAYTFLVLRPDFGSGASPTTADDTSPLGPSNHAFREEKSPERSARQARPENFIPLNDNSFWGAGMLGIE